MYILCFIGNIYHTTLKAFNFGESEKKKNRSNKSNQIKSNKFISDTTTTATK